ncbi:hypothetical protein I2F17_11895 [Acinetobacter sp. B10A]|uniref:hypothetical protein n=1 Tax=Acinetobacter baretiae TaxID=2605383 RepID=UPI001B3C977E|nr:hypothetical protein [Acinetobacter baretiae]MBF7686519.1 hypothetical protein [Acinetobacter baretiae]
MKFTHHAIKRMKERKINEDIVNIANNFGKPDVKGEKVILGIKDINKIIGILEALKKRGGVTIIDVRGTLITTYFNDSFNRKLAN